MAATKRQQDRWTFGRGDYLVIKIALIAAVVAAVAYLVPLLADWIGGRPLQVISETSQAAPVVGGIATQGGATATYAQQISWSLPHAHPVLWILNLLPRLLTSAAVVLGAGLLWRLVRGIQDGLPFGPVAVRTVRALGVTVLMWSVVTPVLSFAATTFTVFEAQPSPAVEFSLAPWSLAPVVIGIVLLALAELFRLGTRLQDDVAGLV